MSRPQSNGSKPLTILLVDDKSSDLFKLKEILQHHNFKLLTAHDGGQALAQVQTEMPDLIVMDIEIPIIDGLTACRIIKAKHKLQHIPVILLSSQQGLSSKLAGFESGCTDYITKPFHPEEVVARIALRLDHTEIIHHLVETRSSRPLNTQKESANNNGITHCQLVIQACELLIKNIQTPPTIEQLARQLQTNRNYLNKAFQESLGLTTFAWLREERLRQASYLLKETTQPLKRISYQCGYSTPSSFITSFKKRFGITPSEYRQKAADNHVNTRSFSKQEVTLFEPRV